MTADQDKARERAARDLARRLEHVTLLADPLAFAHTYWADAANSGWRYLPSAAAPPRPATDPETARTVSKRGADLARELLAKKDQAGDTQERTTQ
ncbi:hypothetical protein NE236_41510 [Actinoallomurus purpureus]|uniref:hypothetical protein n=1 Tax=Actinoallomurus purpureus TaxID=478114 RepID=UPI002093CC9C|nr:hypothetical protein [Actinoallomurus purpureus]MCO6011447.1 hypothetical protein [Actinoallomurus purpureus]